MNYTTKTCKKCTTKFPNTNEFFHKDKSQEDGLRTVCKLCVKILSHKNYIATRNKRVLWRKKSHLKYSYNISIEDYETLLAAQNGICAICGKEESHRSLSVDHNHNTGAVRGLLCNNCNVAIGMLNDDPNLCIKASRYLI